MDTPQWVQELSQIELERRFWRTKMEPSPERLALCAEMTRRELVAKAERAFERRQREATWLRDRSQWLPGFLMGSPL